MPEISRFFGIIIRMYFNDHAPPHFHAHYGEHQAEITIETFEILKGKLPNAYWDWFWNGQRYIGTSYGLTGNGHVRKSLSNPSSHWSKKWTE